MEVATLIFLTSGLFLGWALGANHLGNVFGAAVGARMIKWRTAAILCSICVILGAVISGSGPTQTLGKLGSINALPGAFMTALSAGFAVFLMTKFGLPVSTTQAIVGGIIGWNIFTGSPTDTVALKKIMISWAAGPILAALFAIVLFAAVTFLLKRVRFHILRLDAYTRVGLILAGAFGAYSLGANNIANVMGVFVPASPFAGFSLAGGVSMSSAQQLYLIGGLAIAVGVVTYSMKVVHTVGAGVLKISPIAAWVVVMAHSIVLLLFTSEALYSFLTSRGLPAIPLVPISSSEVIIGALLGIGILQGGKGIRWAVLGRIGFAWMMTPAIAGVVCLIGLYFMQNVFNQNVVQN